MKSSSSATLKKLYKTLKITQAKLKAAQRQGDIAVIGTACRFPAGADTPEKYWHDIIKAGIDTSSQVPADRWSVDEYLNTDDRAAPGKMYSAMGGFLQEDLQQFDNEFFHISAKEAQSLDPQQRLLLEVSWEALENSGLDIQALSGSKTGVFVGMSNNDYYTAHLHSGELERIDAYSVTGTCLNTAAGRLAYLYNFSGPCMVVDTACSSSMVATHLACQSLHNGEADMVLSGGVNLLLTPEIHISFSKLNALSSTGQCKSFDAAGDGYARGEGCGLLVLKRLEDAQRDGDPILAVIKGSAINQDGKSGVLTAPNGIAQQTVIKAALKNANLSAQRVDYIEAHGTGTPLGDPVEMEALQQTYGQAHDAQHPFRVGSVKANIGHLESAAGSASLIKMVAMLQQRYFPPQIHFNTPNPEIDWHNIPVKLCKTGQVWESDNKPRIAGASSFGFSGTNAHIIMQEAAATHSDTTQNTAAETSPPQILLISAKTKIALQALLQRYSDYLTQTENTLSNICYTAALGRSHFKYRIALIAASKTAMQHQLLAYINTPAKAITQTSEQPLDQDAPERNTLEALAQRYIAGETIAWQTLINASANARKIILPNYPFQRQHHWLQPRFGKPNPSVKQVQPQSQSNTLKKLYKSLKLTQAKVKKLEQQKKQLAVEMPAKDIAVIGTACRFPAGADTPEKYWHDIIKSGLDIASQVPVNRWSADDYLNEEDREALGKMYSAVGGFLEEDLSQFDHRFFHMSPKEAQSLDPQQRLLLEVSWEALENAGLAIQSLSGSKTGVFVGMSNNDYFAAHLRSGELDRIDAYTVTGTSSSTATGRLAYLYNFTGPNMVVDTACSSSMVATHLACQSLYNGEADMALSGGVNLILTPEVHISFSKLNALSPTGRCKSFDAEGDGHSRSEGCGLLVLKRLEDAQRDGDPILAVIKGSAINQDGKSNGLTAPNGLAQQAVIRNALKNANMAANAVDYIEAHGTGTPLGDPIEMDALQHTYGKAHDAQHPFSVGSVKANLGHLESAAGSASLIKTVALLQQRYLPPQVNFNTPNPNIAWEQIPVKLHKTGQKWESDKLRTAGVSSFGFSGTNAHLIMQEAPTATANTHDLATDKDTAQDATQLLVISAKTAPALQALAQRYGDYLAQTENNLGDICYTATVGRSHLKHRLALVADSKAAMQTQLHHYLDVEQTKAVKALYRLDKPSQTAPKIAFLFTGQGSQYLEMGRDLYENQATFQQALRQCNHHLQSWLDISLLDILYNEQIDPQLIHQTAYTQSVIFSIEYALAQVWLSWGIKPHAVLGHSIGEYVAACIAGIFSLEDALMLVAERGRLVQSLPDNGRMAVLMTKQTVVQELIQAYPDTVSIAAINAPENIVISGDKATLEVIMRACTERNIPSRLLQISHALHSPLMRTILSEFKQRLEQVQFNTPTYPIVSNATGQESKGNMAVADYWIQHMLAPVQFYPSMQTLDAMGCDVFLEVGATSTLSSLGMQCIPHNDGLWLQSLGMNNLLFNMRPQRLENQNDWQPLLESLAQLYVNGQSINWQTIRPNVQVRKVVLPNYPFQRQRHWLQPMFGQREHNTSATPAIKTATTTTHETKSDIDTMSTDTLSEQQSAALHQRQISHTLSDFIQQISNIEMQAEDADTSLLELGFDSLMLTRFMHTLTRYYDLPFEISWFFQKMGTLNQIIAYIAEHSDPIVTDVQATPATEAIATNDKEAVATPTTPRTVNQTISTPHVANPPQAITTAATSTANTSNNDGYQQIVAQQLQLMSQQIALLQHNTAPPTQENTTPTQPTPSASVPKTGELATQSIEEIEAKHPHLRAMRFDHEELTAQQQQFVNDFCSRYIQRTKLSKQHVIKHRKIHVDWINSLNFRPLLKEITYPIVHARSEGARIWDIDGHEYINMGMGYGVSFFGINPPFIKQVLHEQVDKGYELGPQCDTAGDVAQLVHELTGVERIAFCNTGSEAVMVALRIARTVTERRKIVMFSGSYHGSFDGILAEKTELGILPTTPGTLSGMVEDVMVLNYDTEAALETIREHAHELAAVLVEPVQSRKPELQPQAFLQEIRDITAASGTALIFDEVLTGFRIHPGGCQHHFGITADIVTYGKIIGGGLPMAAVGGKAHFLNAIDGGYWEYGDDSYPASNMTVFAGTFCKHPLSMVVAKACLEEMKSQGSALQEAVNQCTQYFAESLNNFFIEQSVAIEIHYFSSVFRFNSFGKYSQVTLPIAMELLFNLLLEKGVYTWERRICFFSTAITDEDVETLISKVKASIFELRRGGFLLESKPLTALQKQAFAQPAKKKVQPQSSVQRRLYVLSDLDGTDNAYRMAQALRVQGDINLARMQRCLDELLHRHAVLRTGFSSTEQGELIQTIYPEVVCQLQLVESHPSQLDADIARYDTPFDLTRAPIFKLLIFRLSAQQHILVFYSHQIVFDGLSWNIFVQEFNALYAGGSLSNSSRSYVDYLTWQTAWLKSAKAQACESYWLERFSSTPPALMLPTDFPRPQKRAPQGGIVYSTIEAALTTELKTLARQQGVTLNILLLAIYHVLLHKLTGQEDLVVGIPSSGRPPEDFDAVMGMFANTIALRNSLSATQKFTDFLAQLKQRTFTDYDYQDYPFENLVEKLALERDLSRNALFDTMFVYEQADTRSFKLGDAVVDNYDFQKRTALFDLVLEIIEQDGTLQLHIEYSSSLFKHDTIQRWMEYFKILAHALATQTSTIDTPIYQLPWLPEAEIKQLSHGFNDTAVTYPSNTLTELFEAQVEQTPERMAVHYEDRHITYAALNTHANRIAHTLRAMDNFAEGSAIVLFLARSEMMIAGMLGILKAGAAYVPIEIAYPDTRVDYIIKDSGANIVLSEPAQHNRLTQLLDDQDTLIEVVDAWSVTGEQHNPISNIKPDSLAYILYTSGSTGKPKGVLLEHDMIANMLHWRIRAYDMQIDDCILQLASYASDSAVEEIFPQLIMGCSTVLFPPEKILDVEYLADLIAHYQITDLIPTPSFYKVFLSTTRERLSSLRQVIVMGEALEDDVVKLHFNTLPKTRFFNAYGPTENSVNSSWHEMHAASDTPFIGKPIDNTQIYILNAQQQLLPVGVIGEICVGGRGVARGYLNRPDITAEKFLANPFGAGRLYRTGDLGCRLADGNLKFLGRLDDQVQIRGYRVEPCEVENQLVAYPAVQDGVVLPQLIDEAMTLVAYIVGDKTLEINRLRNYLDSCLPNYMIPAFFIVLDSLPLNSRGKLDKQALPDPKQSAISTQEAVNYIAPTSEHEKIVAAIWAQVLQQETVGTQDNYFSLGGDSIKAIQIVSRLRQADFEVQTRDIFHYLTVTELAANLKRATRRIDQSKRTGTVPLTAIQRWFFAHFQAEHQAHYTQATLLSSKTSFAIETVKRSLDILWEHHDSLRLVYDAQAQHMRYDNSQRVQCRVVDLRSESNLTLAIETQVALAHAALDLNAGSLFKAVLMHTQQGDKLLLVLHHLLVDAVSWQILLEDFNTVYQQISQQQSITLPLKTDAFQAWSTAINDYSQSTTLAEESHYWRTLQADTLSIATQLNKQYKQQPILFKNAQRIDCQLSTENTQALLQDAHTAYHTQINDLLLTALSQALQLWHGGAHSLIALEGHGRENVVTADLSRTIGWFTSEYPICLSVDARTDLGQQLKQVKEYLRAIPNNGVGYGILRYLQGMDLDIPVHIGFNYLGEVAQMETKQFQISEVDYAACVHPHSTRPYSIDIEAIVLNGQLQLQLNYDATLHTATTMQTLLTHYQQHLTSLIHYCCQQQASELTPADLTYSELSLDDLDDIFSE